MRWRFFAKAGFELFTTFNPEIKHNPNLASNYI